MELLIWFTGFLVGVLITWMLCTAKPPVSWNPNDYALPDILPCVDVKDIGRGFSVNGNILTQTWEYKGNSQNRLITKRSGVLTQEEFLELWHQNELNFYLKNKEVFDKELNQ